MGRDGLVSQSDSGYSILSRATTARIPTFASNGGTSPAGSTERPTRLPDHLLSRAAGVDERQPERVRADARSSSRTRDCRSEPAGLLHDQRAARAGFALAHAGRDAPACGSTTGRSRCDGGATGAHRGARASISISLSWRAAADSAGRRGFQPQRAAARVGELLLQPSAARVARDASSGRRSVASAASPGSTTNGRAPTGAAKPSAGTGPASTSSTGVPSWRSGCADKSGGTHYAPPGVSMKPLRTWKSPRTGVEYPVSMQVGDLRLEPLMDDQGARFAREHGHDLLGRRRYRLQG